MVFVGVMKLYFAIGCLEVTLKLGCYFWQIQLKIIVEFRQFCPSLIRGCNGHDLKERNPV